MAAPENQSRSVTGILISFPSLSYFPAESESAISMTPSGRAMKAESTRAFWHMAVIMPDMLAIRPIFCATAGSSISTPSAVTSWTDTRPSRSGSGRKASAAGTLSGSAKRVPAYSAVIMTLPRSS